MPIYEYRCATCGCELEAMQKINDDPLVICPECNQPTLKKLLSAAGFRLKGSGWYETDFKSEKKKNVQQQEKQADASKKEPGKKPDAGKQKGSKATNGGSSG